MADPRFDPETLALLAAAREVRIETQEPDGEVHRAIVWIVVDPMQRVLIRSWRGTLGRWYREALAAGRATLLAGGRRIPVRVEHAGGDPDRIEAASRALAEKYRDSSSTPSMLRDEVLETTVEVRPA